MTTRTTAADAALIRQASTLAALAIESHETEIAAAMLADLAAESIADAGDTTSAAPAGWIVYRTSIDVCDGYNKIGSAFDGLPVASLLFATVRQEAAADPAGAAPFLVEIGFWPNTAEPHQEIEKIEQHRIAPVSRHAAIEFTDHRLSTIASEMAG